MVSKRRQLRQCFVVLLLFENSVASIVYKVCKKLCPCRFVDPRLTDINHVVGARGLSDTLAEVGNAASCSREIAPCSKDPALLYHFAGRSKDWEAMLETFGLDAARRSDHEMGHMSAQCPLLE